MNTRNQVPKAVKGGVAEKYLAASITLTTLADGLWEAYMQAEPEEDLYDEMEHANDALIYAAGMLAEFAERLNNAARPTPSQTQSQ